jgi:hypothetical protein
MLMQETFLSKIKNHTYLKILTTLFVGLTIWWISIYARGLKDSSENNYFTLVYPWFSLIGGISGLFFAHKWGSFKSYLGGAISLFSFGLLAQFLGQATYAYYIYIQGITVPYPSFGDVGYFGSVIFYIGGVYLLAKVSGLRFSLKSLRGKFVALFIPVVMLGLSYYFFLQGYEYDWTNKVKIFLDFGYPFGQTIYVSIAILALLMSRNVLGGIMKKPISLFIVTLILQYMCDFTFLYQSSRGTWYVAGINDFMYFVSYFLMTISLIYIGNVFNKIQQS